MAVISSIAKYRALEGNLGTMVLKALCKEPERRYAAVEQLSEDMGAASRWSSDHGPTDTVRYRVTKFVQRHKALVTASGAIAVCPIGGIIVSLREAHRADAERALAVRRVHDVRELARSNVFDLVDSLRQLPGSALAHRRQNSLLQLGRIHPGERWEFCVVFVGGVQTFRDHTPEFTGLAALQAGNAPLGVRRVGSQAQADTRNGEYVSGNFFRTFGVQPWIGRLLTEGDDQEGAPLGAVMS